MSQIELQSAEKRQQFLLEQISVGDILVFKGGMNSSTMSPPAILSLVISVEKDIHGKINSIHELNISLLDIVMCPLSRMTTWSALSFVIKP